jgi:outer membrane receptor protein involved in Fe transport
MGKLRVTVALVVLLSCSQIAWAEEEKKEEEAKVYRLDRVIVREHPIKEEPITITPSVTVINVDKFKKAGTKNMIRDVLMEVPGMDVLRSNITPNPEENINIRGLDQSRFMVYMDGRPMMLFGGFGYYKHDWTTIPLDNIETIEVIRGSHSVLFPNAQGGAINIITKKGIKTDDPIPKVSWGGSWGSFASQSYDGTITGGFLDAIGYSLSGAKRKGNGFLRNNDFDSFDVMGRASWYMPTDGILTLGYKHNEYDMGFAVVNDPTRADYNADYPILRDDADSFRHVPGVVYPGGDNFWDKDTDDADIIFEQPLGPGNLRYQLHRTESERLVHRYIMSMGRLVQNISCQEEYNWGMILEYIDINLGEYIPLELAKDHRFTVGADYRQRGTPANKDWFEIVSPYMQDVWTIIPSLRTTVGVRFYHNEMNSYFKPATGQVAQFGNKTSDQVWTPKFRVDYDYNPNLALYAAASRDYRIP